MQAHYLQHVPFEGSGSTEAWLQKAGYQLSGTQFYISEELPKVKDIDILIVLGGPMSVNDEQLYPWLVNEAQFINANDLGHPSIEICNFHLMGVHNYFPQLFLQLFSVA